MITITGGTYRERCLSPDFDFKFGSGLRACHAIHALDDKAAIEFHTFCSPDNDLFLTMFEDALHIKTYKHPAQDSIGFIYDYPLRTPVIYPRLDMIAEANEIQFEAENILYFGMLEGNAAVKGKRVVYDPQSPVRPVGFKATGSQADELAVVINYKEAQKVAGSKDLNEIKSYFFESEGAAVLVIKMGPKGAMVYTPAEEVVIPVYKTGYVWPIGSGDVFAAIFSYYWMEGDRSAADAAQKASFSTAIYCNSKSFRFEYAGYQENIAPISIPDFPQGKVYLAGPFFTFAQKWLINEVMSNLHHLGMRVFSPLHEVGIGEPGSDVAKQDLKGLDECKIVFAILDGLDPGTLVEVGYALKMKIPVIAYVENEADTDLTMLIGTGCVIEKDLTTALYKCLWMLAEHE
jgi:nucleoside 2-deoxyribosyltransferase